MRGKFRKIISIFIICISSCLLISCGTAKISTDIKVNIDGSSNGNFKIAYDDTIKKFVGEGILVQVFEDENIEVKQYTENQLNVEEVQITTDKTDIKNLLKSNSLGITNLSTADTNELIYYDLNREKGFIQDKYTVNIKLKKSIIDEITNTIDEQVNTNLNNYINDDIKQYISGNLTEYLSGNISTTIKQFIKDIPYDLSISIPFKIVDSNANLKLDDYTVKWNYTLQELNDKTEISLSFMAPNIINICIIALVVIILIIIFIVVMVKKRKRKY